MSIVQKPMLADNKPFNWDKVTAQLPLIGQPKYDGIRMIVNNGVGLSRSLKPIRNRHIQEWVAANAANLQGLDGELVVGDVTASNVFQKTSSGVMSEWGTPNFKYYIFDVWNRPNSGYAARHDELSEFWSAINSEEFNELSDHIMWIRPQYLRDREDVEDFEQECVAQGYEGAILRGMDKLYKHGRATATQGQLFKMKRYVDAEAIITGFEPLMHNANVATTNELGYTTRSSHKEGKIPMDTLGRFICDFEMPDGSTCSMKVGTFKGFTKIELAELWQIRETLRGKTIKFKYFPVGVKDKPRHPTFLGFRDPDDM